MNRTIIKTIVCFLYVCFVLVCMPTVVGKASDINPEQEFRELYLKLLETGDNSVQDISEWELPYMTCYDITNDVKSNEGFIAYHCYNQYNLMTVDEMDYISGTPYLGKFHMSTEDKEFLERYKKIKTLITEVQSNFDEKMTDLDKVLWIHEYVVKNLYYLDLDEIENHLGGATLVNGYGVCEGYAGAMMIFLKAENIPCETISGGGHEWVAVKIDGEWYQVDPTWDDTCSGSGGTHYFFMRNDEEFSKTMSKKHAEKIYSNALDETTGKVSTSIKYTDWYIHDVWDQMFYCKGYWYYVQNNAIKKNNIEGTKETVLYEGTNLQVTGIKDGVLNFNCNGKQQEMSLEQEINPTVTEIPTIVPTPTIIIAPAITPKVTLTPTITPGITNKVTATVVPTVTCEVSATMLPSVTGGVITTGRPINTSVPTATSIVTHTPTVTEEAMITKVPTVTCIPTVTDIPMNTNIPTSIVTVTAVPTITVEVTITNHPTATGIPTVTAVATVTSAVTKTPTVTVSKIPMITSAVTKHPTVTSAAAVSKTPTVTNAVTKPPTVTGAATVSKTPTITGAASENIIPSGSVTPTNVVIPTKSVVPTGIQKLTVTPVIKLKKPVIKSVKNKKGKKVKIVLKKKVSGARGYQVAYSRDKKFKKSVKKVAFTGKTKTIGKLKKNRTYYIKVRAYKKDANGKKIYGPYSKVKKVKIKK